MLQDIAPHIYHNEFSPAPPEDGDFVLCYGENGLWMDVSDGIRLPTVAGAGADGLQYLFAIDGKAFYRAEGLRPEGFAPVDSRTWRGFGPPELRFACAVGESLDRWYKSNRFCGRCGAAMEESGRERALVCPNCAATVYPRINPAVIVAVCDGDRLLLTRYAGRSFKQYALVAGFTEIGETVEDTVRREVFEEAGLRLGELRFYKSQPWVITDTLLLGFYAKLEGPGWIRLQEDELSFAGWFSRDSLPDDHSGISLTGEMIETFRAGKDPFSEK